MTGVIKKHVEGRVVKVDRFANSSHIFWHVQSGHAL